MAKYYDEHVCLCVCLSARICHLLRNHTRDRYQLFFLCMLPMGVAGSSSGRVTKSQEEWAVLGVSSTLTMHCNAFAAKGISREGAMGVHSAGEVCCCYRFRSFRCHFGCLKTVERRTYTAATHVRCRQLLHNYES